MGDHPDSYLRHRRVAALLRRPPGPSILDVGDRAFILCDHVPDATVTGVDIWPPVREPEGHHFVMADFATCDLPSDSFDAVVAIDVLEHVKPSRRLAFVTNAVRIARHQVLMAFPCGPDARDIEAVILRSRSRTAFRAALEQHAALGLPEAAEIEAIASSVHLSYGFDPLTTVAEWLQSLVMDPRDEEAAVVDAYYNLVNRRSPSGPGPGPVYRWLLRIDCG